MTAEFADLLKSSDVTVEQILGSHGLLPAVKSELPALYDFVSKEEQLIGLAEWAVSTKYAEHAKYLEYSVIAVSIFLSANTNLFETIRGSRGLAHFFHNFLAGEDSKNARLRLCVGKFTAALFTLLQRISGQTHKKLQN